jgi:hypothetical protein
VLEQDFCQAFIDYAEHERAQDEIRKLCMKDKNINEYIAAFKCLGHHVGMDLDDPTALQLFTRGLPRLLMDSCIDIENPDLFEQWMKAAQRHQRNWLQKRTIHSDYGGTNNQQQQPNKPSGFFWQRNQGNRPTGQAPHLHLPPRDPDTIDMSTVTRKATMEAEKEKCKKEGQCFECGKQWHLAWNCPD